MSSLIHEEYPVAKGDYVRAGEASTDIKRRLKQLGVSSSVMRRVAVASYEVELNLVIHSLGGRLILDVGPEGVFLVSEDVGPGIPDIQRGSPLPGLWRGHGPAQHEAERRRF